MAWGIVMAFPMVLGMLLLIFADGGVEYQTFGETVVNPPADDMLAVEEPALKKAA
jgi:hypothetical protein